MEQDLVTSVLGCELPVRLALLDADPKGPGRFITSAGKVSWWESPYVFNQANSVFLREQEVHDELRDCISTGGAWVPDNPLAIVRHAALLKYPDEEMLYYISSNTGPEPYAHAWIERNYEDCNDSDSGPCPYTAAIALLRKVIGG